MHQPKTDRIITYAASSDMNSNIEINTLRVYLHTFSENKSENIVL